MSPIREVIFALATILYASITTAQQQKPAPQQTQVQLQQQIDELKKRLDDAELKAKSAALDTDYIARVQKQYESYYKEVLSTQTITISIVGLLITVLLALAARIGFNTFERLTQSAIRDTTAQLRTEYTLALAAESQKLKDSNAEDISKLKETLTSEIEEASQSVDRRSHFQFMFSQGLFFNQNKPTSALESYRSALETYKGNVTDFVPVAAARTIGNILDIVARQDEGHQQEKVREELANPRYDNLEAELAQTAIDRPEFLEAIKARKTTTPKQ